MNNVRLPIAVCAAVAETLEGSHDTLNALFETAGAPGEPPELAHHSKWKTWLQRAGNDPKVDSLQFLGNIIEEFMDLPPADLSAGSELFGEKQDPLAGYKKQKERLIQILEEHGFRYYRGGRVLQLGSPEPISQPESISANTEGTKPTNIEELLRIIIRGLPRSMQPLTHRRKDAQPLAFSSEYDIQDLLHAMMRPWISDIRPEEFTPSYAGSNTRMDFLLPAHKLVIETKRVRTKSHAHKVGDELIIDIEHYRRHKDCEHLWCVVYDPELFISNPQGMINDLEGERTTPDGKVQVKVFIFGASA
ncbi:PD-(D/E)XK nuclease domain-containing protein [Photobacterium alginatilyticum]|uniref:Transposase n=1 Tax=Photobacterium alginatilyticum TaxID=1775171 RepID=A0ABW9YRC4_9GAMM|nr:transposase [Photobacterium alginatilyticum]NBI56265.1 transposase [Photobacterium alginatilyticum]